MMIWFREYASIVSARFRAFGNPDIEMETLQDPDTVKEGENGAFGRDARFSLALCAWTLSTPQKFSNWKFVWEALVIQAATQQ
jgi:hypothetical protein